MTESDYWQKAERLERCALGWTADAERYRGLRRDWRIARASYLLKRCEIAMRWACGNQI
jgi:hypothetical protein